MPSFPEELKRHRRERRMSQLDLSLEADVSGRHIAFLETGRSRPSRSMVLRLAEALQTPLSERNDLLLAAGFAPEYALRALSDETLAPVREAMSRLLRSQEPYPALVMDRAWRILEANRAASLLFQPVMTRADKSFLAYVNDTPSYLDTIENWRAIGPTMLSRLKLERRRNTPDPAFDHEVARFEALVRETCDAEAPPPSETEALFISPIMRVGEARLSFFSTIAHFGAPRDVALSELQIELFFPLDDETDAFFQSLSGDAGAPPA
ncbi:MAG: helix-turn-helix transcriptional regulator [Pseudomonadota bacterium]